MRLRVMDKFQKGIAHAKMWLEALLVKTVFILCGHKGSRGTSWELNVAPTSFSPAPSASFHEWAPHFNFKGWFSREKTYW